MSTLTIAIATHGARLAALTVARLPQDPAWRYLVVWQPDGAQDRSDLAGHAASLTARPDITLVTQDGRGAARSRNVAITQATTPLLLFADDDMTFAPAGWQALCDLFAAHPDVAFLCARLQTESGAWRKAYGPDTPRAVTRFNVLKLGTPELALRLTPIRAAGLAFDPDFGAGARYPVGDEYVFVSDAMVKGLRGLHVPVCVGYHPADSSGVDFQGPTLAARSAVFDRTFGRIAPLMRAAFVIKHRRRFASWRAMARFVTGAGL